jgi:hypothetical protein
MKRSKCISLRVTEERPAVKLASSRSAILDFVFEKEHAVDNIRLDAPLDRDVDDAV